MLSIKIAEKKGTLDLEIVKSFMQEERKRRRPVGSGAIARVTTLLPPVGGTRARISVRSAQGIVIMLESVPVRSLPLNRILASRSDLSNIVPSARSKGKTKCTSTCQARCH